MKKNYQISDAEWEVMKLIWSESPQTANQIVEKLSPVKSWNQKTIKTLINRLVKKGVLGYDKKSRTFYYYPLVLKSEIEKLERRSFLTKVYNGALKPMIASFLEEENLSPDEIEELKQLLIQKEGLSQ